jgi:LDH2 family malate/lactate/ureidoglycolate dehydrogenase
MSDTQKTETVLVKHDLLRIQVSAILTAWGIDEADIGLITDAIVETDLRAIDSHGISMLPLYDRMRLAGQLNIKAQPRILNEMGATALIDADAGLGHAVATRAMRRAIEKSKTHGCGVVVVRNSHHFGAAGIYAEIAAQMGVVGIVASSTRFITMVPTFAAEPVLGTNPIAFAAPAGTQPDVLFDMATTSAAGNKVKAHWLKERDIPAGWVVDEHGKPVTDAAEAVSIVFERPEGGLTPLGGTYEGGSHKGYGLALMVHILSAVLSGASFSPLRNRTQQPNDPDNIGHFFLAIDPAAFREAGAFEADLDAVIEVLRATRPADPKQKVLVAGDPERNARQERLANGIPVPPRLQTQIREVAANCSVEYMLEPDQ